MPVDSRRSPTFLLDMLALLAQAGLQALDQVE